MISRLVLAAMVPIAAGCAETSVRPAAAPRAVTTPAAAAPTAASALAPSAALAPTGDQEGIGFALPMRVVTSVGGTLVFVPVRVNGKGPYEFVLDTGSSNSSVDRSLVRKLGLPQTGERHRVQGVTGSGTVPIVKVRHWALGGVPLRGTSLAVVDLGMGVSGLLGSDELRRFGSVTLDFQHNKVFFHR